MMFYESARRINLEFALKRIDPSSHYVQPLAVRSVSQTFKREIDDRYEWTKRVFIDDKCNDRWHSLIDTFEVKEGELQKQVRQAKAAVLEAMLPAYDTLTLSLEHEKDMSFSQREGLEAAMRQFEDAFAASGAEKVGEVGERFDPLLHEAVLQVPGENGEKAVIKEVRRAGIRVGARLLRPAMVVVSG